MQASLPPDSLGLRPDPPPGMQPTVRIGACQVLLASILSLLFACRGLGQDAPVVRLGEGVNARTYIEHVPADLDPAHPAPLLFVFHSGGGSAQKAMEAFAAVASILSSIPEPLAANSHPSQPLSVLFTNGTKDPIVPFGGGEVGIDLFPRLPNLRKKESRGRVIATEEAVGLWVSRDELDPVPRRRPCPT